MVARLVIPRSLYDAMIAHAQAELPNECCGLLAGRAEGETGVALARFALANDLSSPTEYLSNPRELLDAMKAMRRSGTDVLAIYHSHPSSPPVPSRTDLERNHWGEAAVHLIIGLGERTPQVQAWRLDEATYRAVEFAIV